MSREPYNSAAANSGTRSPGTGPIRSTSTRRITELPTVDRSPSRDYATRGSPSGNFFFSLTPHKNSNSRHRFRLVT